MHNCMRRGRRKGSKRCNMGMGRLLVQLDFAFLVLSRASSATMPRLLLVTRRFRRRTRRLVLLLDFLLVKARITVKGFTPLCLTWAV